MPATLAISETELIQECKNGDLKHQEKLYKHFYSYAIGVGLRYFQERDDALEVVNDAFIKVFKSISGFRQDQLFKPWLRRIVINTALDRIRKDQKHRNHTDLDDAVHVSVAPKAVDDLNARDILQLMQALPEMQRTVFNLYEIDGYSHDEIAELLNISASFSRVNLSRAKDKLRTAYKSQYPEYERNERAGTY